MDDGKDTYTMDNEKRQRNFTGLMNGERSSQEPLLLLSHTPSGPAYASCHYDGLASSRFSPSRHGKRMEKISSCSVRYPYQTTACLT